MEIERDMSKIEAVGMLGVLLGSIVFFLTGISPDTTPREMDAIGIAVVFGPIVLFEGYLRVRQWFRDKGVRDE